MKSAGFTLIEIVITLSLIALLATLSAFFYSDPLLRFRRVEGHAALMQLAMNVEAYYAKNLSYSDITLESLATSPFSEHQHYQLHIEASQNTYTLTATPQGAQAKDNCGVLTLTHLNQKAPTDCW